MTYSMTGFASVRAESPLGTLSIELKSVNSRYLDVFFKVPDVIKGFEVDMRKALSNHIVRGKVECMVRFSANSSDELSVNDEYVQRLMQTSIQLSERYGIAAASVGDILRLPHVLVDQSPDIAALKQWFVPLFEQAVQELKEQRLNEGEHLKALLSDRLDNVRALVDDVATNYQASIDSVRAKLYDKLEALAERHHSEIDEVRFEQETIYLLQKMDVAEEIDRLNGHINAVGDLLNASVPVGRKLDFLMQEMNRESNTVASKSQNLGLTMNAVELKVLLEQMREQIQNVE